MDLKKFIEKFSEQFDETDVSVFTKDTVFKDIDEWSSLVALSVIAMIDEEYNARLKGDDIRNASTINDLYNIIQSKI